MESKLTMLPYPPVLSLFRSQPCLPIYVSELKLAFSLSMGIQFGSGVFWVCVCGFYIYIVICWWKASWNIFLVLTFLFFSIPGYFTCYEHQADGPDQKETWLYGSSRIKQIRSRCFLAPCCFNTHILISITWLSYAFSMCWCLNACLKVIYLRTVDKI